MDEEAAERAGWRPLDLALAYLDGGAPLLQLRGKRLRSGPFLELCDAVVQAARRFGTPIVVNDRVDLAALSGAAGVHVGQHDVPPADARAQLGPAAIVGFSTHTAEQIAAACREPVSYIAVGPVFGTVTKETGYAPVGLDLVREARRRIPEDVPLVAIGGITLERAPAVLAAGASAVAVIGDLLHTSDPAARVGAYRRIVG